MKVVLRLSLLCLVVPCLLMAQTKTFTFTAKKTVFKLKPGSHVEIPASVTNTSNDSLHIEIRRLQNNLPAGWMSNFCSSAMCLRPDESFYTRPDANQGLQALAPGESENFTLDVHSNSTTLGVSKVLVQVKNLKQPNEVLKIEFTVSTQSSSSLTKGGSPLTGSFKLHHNYPNPFNPSTHIPFEIGGHQAVNTQVIVYNVIGETVKVLLNQRLTPGSYQVDWNSLDAYGNRVPSGMYFYELRAGNVRKTARMLLVQ